MWIPFTFHLTFDIDADVKFLSQVAFMALVLMTGTAQAQQPAGATASPTPASPKPAVRLPDVVLEVTLKDGRVFKNSVVKEIRQYGVLLANVKGAEEIPADMLPDDLRKRYGLDTKEVADYWVKKRAEGAEKALEDEILKEAAADAKEREDAKNATRRYIQGKVVEKYESGRILVRFEESHRVTYFRSRNVQARVNPLQATPMDGWYAVVRGTGDRFSLNQYVYMYGFTTPYKDDNDYHIYDFERVIEPKTVKDYYASLPPAERAAKKRELLAKARDLRSKAYDKKMESMKLSESYRDTAANSAKSLIAEAEALEKEAESL
ncbi:hypothetical protein DB346_07940 [Verrucomicrobia bacterium LW23]|nr:hypothetical protein DB346_07940 [Verrucomicrobia bacterium LW23]